MKKAIQPFLLLICILLFAFSAKAELSTNLQIQKEMKPRTNLTARETYVDFQGNPVVASDKGYAQKEYLYNASNQLKEVHFLDAEGKLTNCIDGYATVTYEYKSNKVIRTTYMDAAGQPGVGPEGYAIQEVNRGTRGLELETYEYDPDGKLLTHSVTEYVDIKKDNLVKSKSWYNDQNELTTGSEGYAKVEYEYFKRKKCHITYYNPDGTLYYNAKVKYAEKEQVYEKGNISELNYYGEGRTPIAGPDGYASAKYTYAQGGKEILTMYYNADGTPFLTKNGYCGIRQIKENRRVIDESYYSDDGVRGRNIEGYSRTAKRYTLRGQILQQCYYDENDNLMIPEEIGYAKIKNTYSTRFLIKTEYFDENDEPAYCLDGYAVAVHSYADKLRTETVYYDTDGKTIINGKDGYAKIVYLYDDNKQNIGEAYYDVDGNRAAVSGEADEIRTTQDNNGNTTSISYWKNGEPDIGEEGCHEIRMEYTADNKLRKEAFLDSNGQLTASIYGYAGIEKLYNSAKREMATLYYNENGELMTTPEKEYAYVLTIPEEDKKALDVPEEEEETEKEEEEDEDAATINETVEDEDIITGTVYVEYYGTDRKLMNLSSGYAYIIRQTDEKGRAIRENYYDKDGNRAVLKNGYDEIRQEFYTESWRPSRTEYYLNGEKVLYNDNYAAIEREYDENWNIIAEWYYDTYFQPAACKNGYEVVRREFNEDKQIIAEDYYDHSGQPMTSKKGVYRTAYDYNENGKITKEAYFDIEGIPMLCSDGYAGLGRLYNEQGTTLATMYYSETGELMLAPGKEYAYIMTIPKVEKERTAEEEDIPNQTFYIEYYGTDGKLMNLKAGYAYVIRTYDEQGRTISEIYFDKDGNRSKLDGEYDEIRQTYSENNKRPSRIEYYLNDMLALRSTGYAVVDREYDEAGNIIIEKYYNTDLQPTVSKNGYEVIRKEYNENKRVIAEAYYNHNGQPMTNKKGVYRTAYEYNENGKATKEAYFDADGDHMPCTDGYAGVGKIYNDQGTPLATLYYNEAWELILTPGREYAYVMTIPVEDGAKEDKKTSTKINRIEYYGTDQKLMNLSSGYASILRSIDEQGRTIRDVYFDQNRQKTALKNGYDEFRNEYKDDFTKPSRIEYYLNDKPVLLTDGYAAVEREYDEEGYVISEKYFDTDFNPVKRNGGYEMIRKEYNEDKRVSKEMYFDHDEQPMVNNQGVYQKTFEYNEKGKITREAYYDAEGKPMVNKNGSYLVEREYDEDGNKISETNFFVNK